MTTLPSFRYHPDPLSTGEVVPSDTTCLSCGQARRYIYNGPVYSVEELNEALCPWCIADGTAAAKYDATFTDNLVVPDDVPPNVVTEILTRTPGYSAWQQEYWIYHCGDGAAYLGRVVLHENDHYNWSAEQSEEYARSLHPDGDATGYLFRCLHCGAHLAYTDMS